MNTQEQINALKTELDELSGLTAENIESIDRRLCAVMNRIGWLIQAVEHIVEQSGRQPPAPFQEAEMYCCEAES